MSRNIISLNIMAKILLPILLIISIFSLLACSNINTPQAPVIAFYKALEMNDSSVAIKLFYIPTQKDTSNKQIGSKVNFVIAAAHTEIQSHRGIKNITINSVKYSNDKQKAIVNLTINYKDGQSKQDQVAVIQHDGKWLLALQ